MSGTAPLRPRLAPAARSGDCPSIAASPIPPDVFQRYAAAGRALQMGEASHAVLLAQDVINTAPRFGPAHHLMGVALARLGDRSAAEKALRQAAALDKREPAAQTALADFLAEGGRMAEAERAYRAALALDRRFPPAAIGLAHLLLWAGRPGEAAQAVMPLAAGPNPPPQALDLHVRALAADGRPEEALVASRKAEAAGIANADLGSAQILADLGRFAEAEAGFRAVLARDPNEARARRGLARAVFAGPQGLDGALAVVDEGQARQWSPMLAAFKASLLNQAARAPEALATAEDAVARLPNDPGLHAVAATAAAMALEPETAHAHAEQARRLAPDNDEVAVLLAETALGIGRADQALALLEPLRRKAPLDQKRIALHATALRLAGDARYRSYLDYDRFVRTYTLEPPKGWASLESFLADLAARLNTIHDGQGATLDQSVRGGTQTNLNLVQSRDPLIKALFSALSRPVADYVAALGRSEDAYGQPLAARNQGGFAYGGAWTVRLRAGGGRHVNHIHPEGWLSSAFYVQLPSAIGEGDDSGWITFGEPGTPTRPALGPEHKVRPEPGRLVLFPSYLWHGALPFGGGEQRLTFAFDVVPAKA